ncbi:transposase [Sphingobacterium sp. MYb388]
MKSVRKYDRTFKERAVELSKDRKNISELARELGVSTP